MANDDITEAEIWEDLDSMYMLQERLPGDIDAEQIARRYGISKDAAWRRMEHIAISGGFEILNVRDDTSKTKHRKVIRKVGR